MTAGPGMSADPPVSTLPRVIDLYEGLKRQYVPADEGIRALIHVHAGLALWLLLALLLRKRLSSLAPLIGVWVIMALTELFDISTQWPVRQDWVWRHAASDMAQSLTWPTILWAVCFWLWRGDAGSQPDPSDIAD